MKLMVFFEFIMKIDQCLESHLMFCKILQPLKSCNRKVRIRVSRETYKKSSRCADPQLVTSSARSYLQARNICEIWRGSVL